MADSVKMVYNRQSCRKAPQAFISCLISFMYNSKDVRLQRTMS